jgi:hypothetical protein
MIRKPLDWETGARQALSEAGAIQPCPRGHFDIYERTRDSDVERGAYAIGTNMHKAGVIQGRRAEFMDYIKDMLEHTDDTCLICYAADQWR